MALGKMGSARGGFGALGAQGKATTVAAPPAGTTGQPMGLLLALTYAS